MSELASPAPARVLVVDDDQVDRMAVRRLLARGGVACTVDEAPDAAAAMRLLGAAPAGAPYDCVFLDYNLPGADGLALLRQVRAAGHGVPVVMLTGHGDEQLVVDLMKAGATDYIAKATLSAARLAHSLRQAMELERAQREARRSGEALAALAERLRLATAYGGIGTWDLDVASARIRLDASARAMVGLAGDVSDDALALADAVGVVLPEDVPAVEHALRDVLERGGEYFAEYRVRHADGSARWIEARGRAVPGLDGATASIVGVVIDITDRRRREEALREEAALVDALQRVGSALATELDLERIVRTVVAEARRLTGAEGGVLWYDDEREGKPVGAPDEDGPPPPRVAIDGDASAGTPDGEATLARADGSPYASVIAVAVRSPRGGTLGRLAFGHGDPHVFGERQRRLAAGIAEWAAVAMDNARLYASERHARTEAERANRAKSDFLAVMSHELRTPLNAIGGYAQLVDLGVHGPVNPAQQEAMSRIQRAQAHLLSLINDILHFAKLEAGRVQLDLRDVPLHETLDGLQAFVAPQVAAKGLSYEYRSPAELGPLAVRADRDRLQQVLLNLLGNAVKFTPAGGRIAVSWERDAAAVRVHVRDTGIGIPADRIPLVFDPFVQVHRRSGGREEGVGLGLAISRELARAMGGELSATSEVGRGSTFTLTLPRADAPTGPAVSAVPVAASGAIASLMATPTPVPPAADGTLSA